MIQDLATPGPDDVSTTVRLALAEDVGSGDRTAALLAPDATASASVLCRESAVLCGVTWFDEVFRQLCPEIVISWRAGDADAVEPGDVVCTVTGPAAPILTGERTGLNFLQLLSGTATIARDYARALQGSATRILIKDNHIANAGSIAGIVAAARRDNPDLTVEVEVNHLTQLDEALAAGADIVMLDNFQRAEIGEAVARSRGRAKLEFSGNVAIEDLPELASSGVDYISDGALTKNVRAIDFSMGFDRLPEGQ